MMNRQSAILSERLTTICSSRSEEMRAQVVDALQTAVPCDSGTFVTCVKSGGQLYFDGLVSGGDRTLVDAQLAFSRKPVLETPWMPENLRRAEINNFIRTRNFFTDEYLFSFEVQKKLYLPLEVGDQLRAVLFDATELIGWIGLSRRGDRTRFSLSEQKLLATATPRIKAALAAAKALQSDQLQGDLCAIFTPGASIEHASKAFTEWLTPERRSYLSRWAQHFDEGTDESAIKVLDGAEVRFVRLDGVNGVRYVATVDRAKFLELRPAYWLTPRQREVAEHAAVGATSKEIARALDISVYTVRDHIKAVYDRLGIASRAELATLMADG